MYYNKSLLEGIDLNSIEDIIEKCETEDYKFLYNLGNFYYSSGFFFGTGCESEWIYNSLTQEYTLAKDTFNSNSGKIALDGIYKIIKSSCFVNTANEKYCDKPGVIISGCAYDSSIKSKLGENYAVCKLPSFVGSDGNKYQISPYMNGKVLCIKPQNDKEKENVLNDIANYLSDEECQYERYLATCTMYGHGFVPSNLNSTKYEKIKDVECISALVNQDDYGIPLYKIHPCWYDLGAEVFKKLEKSDGTDASYQSILTYYSDELSNFPTGVFAI